MAEVIGLASGLLALAGFSIQSTKVLIQTIHSFKSSRRQVKSLKAELEALVKILESILETCDETDTGFTTLKYPVLECGKACEEFEAYITKHAPRSDQDRRSFRDWAGLNLRGDSIEEFKNKITANKGTITIALADANL
jgi:Fungal N-terminal domain of STAND proteins